MGAEVELGLLRSIFSDPVKAMPEIVDLLDADDFTVREYGVVYGAAKRLYLRGKAVDELTVAGEAKDDLISVSTISSYTLDGGFEPSTKAIGYSELIREEKASSVLKAEATILSRTSEDSSLDEKLARIEAVTTYVTTKRGTVEKATAKDGMAEVRQAIVDYGVHPPIPTPWKGLDRLVPCGYQPGHLWVMMGYTSAGKTMAMVDMTAFMLQRMIDHQGGVAFFSLEMTREEIYRRVVANVANEGSNAILQGTERHPDKVEAAMKDISSWPLWVYESTFDLPTMFSTVRKLQRVHPISVVFLDYAQLINDGGNDLFNTMRQSAFLLKEQAKRLGVCIIVGSQVNNESVKEPHEVLHPAKGGGDLVASSEVAILLQKGGDGNDRHVLLSVRKNKHGACGKMNLEFKQNWSRLLQT
jgi:replicative DNA helicase